MFHESWTGVFTCNVRHEGPNLLQQLLHAALTACLEEGGDGQRSNGAILQANEIMISPVEAHDMLARRHDNICGVLSGQQAL